MYKKFIESQILDKAIEKRFVPWEIVIDKNLSTDIAIIGTMHGQDLETNNEETRSFKLAFDGYLSMI